MKRNYLITEIIYKGETYKDKSIKSGKSLLKISGAVLSGLSKNSTESVVKSKFSGFNFQGYLILDNEDNVIGEFYIFSEGEK